MRLSFRRFIVFCYLTVCGILSLLNYRYSTIEMIEPHNVTMESKPQAIVEGVYGSTSSLLSDLWRMITKRPKDFRPTYNNTSAGPPTIAIWPEDSNLTDRVLEQLNHVNPLKSTSKQVTIYLPHGISSWNVKGGNVEFENCLVNNCFITDNETPTYHAALHRNNIITTVPRTSRDQIWVFYSLESPDNTGRLITASGNLINWTATYRFDSDIVTPYEKFSLYSTSGTIKKNYAKNKTKKVAWFVSNCFTNNDRLIYARNLSSFINVDIFGGCGHLKCSRMSPNCFNMLNRDYKFYLAFENSNCRDYITEKFFFNGLQHDIIPIVMGARKEDYERVAPPHSFIHVDDFDSPQTLAAYLQQLDSDETLYNEYFRWKTMGEFVNTRFWCRLCSMLNEPKQKFYVDFEYWWRNSNVCARGKWPKTTSS